MGLCKSQDIKIYKFNLEKNRKEETRKVKRKKERKKET